MKGTYKSTISETSELLYCLNTSELGFLYLGVTERLRSYFVLTFKIELCSSSRCYKSGLGGLVHPLAPLTLCFPSTHEHTDH